LRLCLEDTHARKIANLFAFSLAYSYLCTVKRKNDTMMEEKKFKNYSDQEFKEALRATLNLKKEWMASVAQREKELGIQ